MLGKRTLTKAKRSMHDNPSEKYFRSGGCRIGTVLPGVIVIGDHQQASYRMSNLETPVMLGEMTHLNIKESLAIGNFCTG